MFSIWNEIKSAGEKVDEVIKEVAAGVQKATDFYGKVKATWAQVSGPTITAASNVIYDAVQTISAAEAAAAPAGTANIPATITLSETTLTNVRKFIADVKAGEAQAVADAAALGLKF